VIGSLDNHNYLPDLVKALKGKFDVTVFYGEPHKQAEVFPECSMQFLNRIYAYSGYVFSFHLDLTKFLVKCPGDKKILLYDPILQWTKLKQFWYDDIQDVYLNKRVQVYTLPHHIKTFKSVWGYSPKVIENLTPESIEQAINGY
jgi:hypothetical protein